MNARSKPTIQTDTLARILADQGHVKEARAMLQHLQTEGPKKERHAALSRLDDQQRAMRVGRLQRLLDHISHRATLD